MRERVTMKAVAEQILAGELAPDDQPDRGRTSSAVA